MRLLFLDFRSAFNTIIPQILVNKLSALGLPPCLCNWILDFLTDRPQTVRINNTTSQSITCSPQGCTHSPLLYTLYASDCKAHYKEKLIVKFADDSAVVGLITRNDKAAYRQDVEDLRRWCKEHNLILHISKTKQMVVDFHRSSAPPPPLYINGAAVEIVSCFKYLGVYLTPSPGATTP